MTDMQAKTATLVMVQSMCQLSCAIHGADLCICQINKILSESAWEEQVREQEQQAHRLYEGLYD